MSKSIDKLQYGDFQTPIQLARKVVDVLKQNHGISPDVVIEPTCGKGAFIRASCEGFSAPRILGFDINPNYVEKTKSEFNGISKTNRVLIKVADFFNTDWKEVLSHCSGYILVIGNPPWVTNSELESINSKNMPKKSNFHRRKGIDAITGSANFDISEWMLLQHVNWLSDRDGAIAFICKYSVARKVIRQIMQSPDQKKLHGHIYSIDAKLHFNASVEACLLVLTTDIGKSDSIVYESLDSSSSSIRIGERDGLIVSNIKKYERWRHLRGQVSKYIWRSGVKHDCAKIMELEPYLGLYRNGLGETVDIEDAHVYPLLKGSDVCKGDINTYRKVVLITQKVIGEDTLKIKNQAPKTWAYLVAHKKYLDERRSSVYRKKPPFSIFGIGDYSFKPWKIAISGLHKKLFFNLIGPLDGKTAVFDDTVNYLSFDSKEEAEFIYSLITSSPATEFINSMIFWDEKRPITAKILRQLSLKSISEELGSLDDYHYWNQAASDRAVGQLELEVDNE